MKKRDSFTGSLGFVLAAAGSAVGLGNIWRFPYLAARYGGGMFLLVYLIFVVTFGFSLMLAENALGRKTGKSALEAFSAINKKFAFIGVLSLAVPCIILPYYSVIGGWVIKYLLSFITGSYASTEPEAYFNDMLQSPFSMIIFQLLFNFATTAIVTRGVKKGIERLSAVLMPVLVLLAAAVTVYSLTLDGAAEGVKYFLIPDLSHFSIMSVVSALGQMFFSMSLAMGTMITYGSYLPKTSDLEKSVRHIELFDTAVAVLSGLMVIPAVFAFSGGDAEALGAGPRLMFVTLPRVFEKMGMTPFIGTAFFLLVLFAALTSSVSVMEAIVSSVCDKTGRGRGTVAVIIGALSFLIGLFPALGYSVLSDIRILGMDILDFMDFITNSVLMPVVALLTCIFISRVLGVEAIDAEVELSGKFRRRRLFHFMIKYAAPALIAVILVTSVLGGLGIVSV